jgi:DNA polymerase
MDRVTIDFETRSASDIKHGAYRYAQDASTEVMCLAILFPDEAEAVLWHPEYPSLVWPERGHRHLVRLFRLIEQGILVEAHNVGFERAIWKYVGVDRLEWPEVPPNQWRCSAALAASFALPRSLEGASRALGLVQEKDNAGHKVMMKVSKPRAALKADLELVAANRFGDKKRWKEITKPKSAYALRELYPDIQEVQRINPWHEKAVELQALFDYCQQDVVVEHAISSRLGYNLPAAELGVWQLDQEMNERGVLLDMEMVHAALKVSDECKELADARISELTNGTVVSLGQRQAFMDFVNSQPGDGYIENTQKPTIEEALKHPTMWSQKAYEALELRQSQAKTSTKKYTAMANVVCHDGRARGLLAYHGADTGRWAGRLIQPQNFPRGDVKESIDSLCEAVLTGDREYLDLLYGDPMKVLSSALRGAMTASDGYDLICADYSAIEARGLFWISGDEDALNVFRRGHDIYKDMASSIYRVHYDQVSPDQRQMGKQAILGLGYQMGAAKFADTCQGYGIEIDEEFAKRVVGTYRSSHQAVKDFWYGIEHAAQEAASPGSPGVTFGRLRLFVEDDFLKIRLPSGRCLHYYEPRVQRVISKWQDDERQELYATALREDWSVERAEAAGLNVKTQLTFLGINSQTRKFGRQQTYGGKLTENIVQALSRDVMAEALLWVAASGVYVPLLTVHDEVIAEVAEGCGSVEEFEQLISRLPDWATGFPLAAEGWRGKRYRK